MKKLLVVMLLAVAMVVPAFASKDSKFDVVGKIGLIASPSYSSQFRTETDWPIYKGDADNSFAIAVEGYYKFDEKLSVGLGLSYGFESKLSSPYDNTYFYDDGEAKLGFTNIYVSVKPSLFESIYAIGQIGYGLSHGSFYDSYNQGWKKCKVDGGGLYWGLGAGVEYKSFIFEVLYSVNNATFEERGNFFGAYDYLFRYSTLNINLGYKFSI